MAEINGVDRGASYWLLHWTYERPRGHGRHRDRAVTVLLIGPHL